MSGNHNMYCSANELADGVPPALWANPKTEIHGIVDVRTYPLEGFIPLCVKHDADTMLRQQQAEIEALKAKLELHEAMDNQCASLIQQFRKAQEK